MTVRVTHTPCYQPVDLTDNNRVLHPDTDLEHHCPVTDGPYNVVRWGRMWSIENILDRHQKQPRYDSQHQAQTEADRRNRADAAARAPRPVQADLFSSQEAT